MTGGDAGLDQGAQTYLCWRLCCSVDCLDNGSKAELGSCKMRFQRSESLPLTLKNPASELPSSPLPGHTQYSQSRRVVYPSEVSPCHCVYFTKNKENSEDSKRLDAPRLAVNQQ